MLNATHLPDENALTEYQSRDTIASVPDRLNAKIFDNPLLLVKVSAFLRLGILRERQAGWEERCAQGNPDNLDQSPKSFGIS